MKTGKLNEQKVLSTEGVRRCVHLLGDSLCGAWAMSLCANNETNKVLKWLKQEADKWFKSRTKRFFTCVIIIKKNLKIIGLKC